MSARGQVKQRTFYLEDGEKVTIKSRQLGGVRGFFVWINGQKFNSFNKFIRQDAEDSAYVRWVSQQDPGDTAPRGQTKGERHGS